MIIQPKALWGPLPLVGASSGSSAIIFTAPNIAIPTLITAAVFSNIDSNAHTFSVYLVRAGGNLTSACAIILAKSLAALQDYPSPELNGLVLSPNDTLWANADTANFINTVGSGWGV